MIDYRIQIVREMSVYDLMERTHDMLKNEYLCQCDKAEDEWMVFMLLGVNGNERNQEETKNCIKKAVSLFDTYKNTQSLN